jgi:hypothetical protein
MYIDVNLHVIHSSYSLDKVPPKFNFFLAMSQFDWPITQNRLKKLWRLTKVLNRVPSIWHSYIGERRTTFAKAYGIKVKCYWELFGGTHQKTWGTHTMLPY